MVRKICLHALLVAFLFAGSLAAGEKTRTNARPTFSRRSLTVSQSPLIGNTAHTWPMPGAVNDESSVGSRGKIFLKSLLIPGWGQYGLGAKTSARTFLISETSIWGSVIAFYVYGKWLKDDYIAFAAAHAGVDTRGKDDRYWVDIGNFFSIYDYNEEKLRQRNLRDQRNPAGNDYWQWDDNVNRNSFESLRVRSDEAFSRSSFAIAGVVANHVISAIHALWIARKIEKKAEVAAPKLQLGWHTPPAWDGGVLSVRYDF